MTDISDLDLCSIVTAHIQVTIDRRLHLIKLISCDSNTIFIIGSQQHYKKILVVQVSSVDCQASKLRDLGIAWWKIHRWGIT